PAVPSTAVLCVVLVGREAVGASVGGVDVVWAETPWRPRGPGGGRPVHVRRPVALRGRRGRLGRHRPDGLRSHRVGGYAGTAAPVGAAGPGVRGGVDRGPAGRVGGPAAGAGLDAAV